MVLSRAVRWSDGLALLSVFIWLPSTWVSWLELGLHIPQCPGLHWKSCSGHLWLCVRDWWGYHGRQLGRRPSKESSHPELCRRLTGTHSLALESEFCEMAGASGTWPLLLRTRPSFSLAWPPVDLSEFKVNYHSMSYKIVIGTIACVLMLLCLKAKFLFKTC